MPKVSARTTVTIDRETHDRLATVAPIRKLTVGKAAAAAINDWIGDYKKVLADHAKSEALRIRGMES